MEKFQKNDGDKPQISLVPVKAIEGMAEVFAYGAEKYGQDNWRLAEAKDLKRYVDALYRHINAMRNGELNDKESGLPHICHAMTNAAIVHSLLEGDKGNEMFEHWNPQPKHKPNKGI